MTFWEWLHRLGPGWPDSRGWIGAGAFFLAVLVLAMLADDAALRKDEFFKTIATLIVGAFIKDVVAWAYAATKGGGELATRNADLVQKQAEASPPIAEEPKP